MRIPLVLLLVLLSRFTAFAGDSLPSDSTKKIRHSSAFLTLGGPLKFSLDYAYRLYPKKTPWLAVDLRTGLGGDSLGTGFHYGGTALFFKRRFKAELGAGLVFSQLDEWAYLVWGGRYEGKRGFMTEFDIAGSFYRAHKKYAPGAQFIIGWRF